MRDSLKTEGNARNLHTVTNVKTITQLYDKESEETGAAIVFINTGEGRLFIELLGGIRYFAYRTHQNDCR